MCKYFVPLGGAVFSCFTLITNCINSFKLFIYCNLFFSGNKTVHYCVVLCTYSGTFIGNLIEDPYSTNDSG